jgi:hypothetical protein
VDRGATAFFAHTSASDDGKQSAGDLCDQINRGAMNRPRLNRDVAIDAVEIGQQLVVIGTNINDFASPFGSSRGVAFMIASDIIREARRGRLTQRASFTLTLSVVLI